MLIFDTETTGLVSNMTTRADHQPEIIEFAGIYINPDEPWHEPDKRLDLLIKPQYPITAEITKMNGIDNDMVCEAPSFKDVASQIRDFIEAADAVVAHNAAFDRDMVNIEFAKLGQTKVTWPLLLCSIEQTIHLTGYRLSLSDLHKHLFGEGFSGAHRAMVDVEALARCIIELRKRGEM